MTAAPATAPPATWVACVSCGRFDYGPRFDRRRKVCAACGHHHPMTAVERADALLDDGSATTWEPDVPDADPLDFTDRKPYVERVREARSATGLREAIVLARGRLTGIEVTLAVLDFRFLGGSLGSAVGDGVVEACRVALRDRTPLIVVSSSGGARMQEGVVSLLQMARTSQALSGLDDAGLLTVSVLTDPVYGGVAASFATLCDVTVAEPRARFGFAGRRVIEQTVHEQLPDGFQTAEFLLDHGQIDMILPRSEMPARIGRLLAATRSGAPDGHHGDGGAPVVTDAAELPDREPWDVVRGARRLDRPTTVDYVSRILDGFVELHGDRLRHDCPAIVAGVGLLHGMPVAVVGTQKGHTAEELAARSYGMPSPAGYRKAARVMRLAEKLVVPVVTLVDTSGAYPGVEAERDGQALAIAASIRQMSRLRTPTVAVVTGEGGSGGALALAVADRVFVLSGSTYSVITAEGCASILWRDPAAAPEAAAALRGDPASLLRLGVIDGVVQEPPGGAPTDPFATAESVATTVRLQLEELTAMDLDEMVGRRIERYMAIGAATTASPDGESR